MYFNKNQEITDINNVSYKILDLLGEGGQWEVYLVMDDENNNYALKIYKNKVNEEVLLNLEHNIEKGAPLKEFVWPKKIFEENKEDGAIGYLMDIRQEEYASFISYLNGKSPFESRSLLIKWCI